MFRKPKRNFRQRVLNSDSDDEFKGQNDDSMDAESSKDSFDAVDKSSKKNKEKKKKEKSKTVLSFDHEEGTVHLPTLVFLHTLHSFLLCDKVKILDFFKN